MPAPARTTTDAVVTAARELIERDGLEALTMQSVASAVGIKGPSLYKRVDSRDALVALVADQVADELGAEIESVLGDVDAAADLRALADAFRAFARRNPASYPLLFSPRRVGFSDEVRLRSVLPVRRVAARLAGEEHELAAARLITAWAHGWVVMELAGAFQLGGDLEEAWDFAVDALVTALRR
jgi:AcrR family transcriptional regulator